jgi:predicted Fe-Mo cluster-binding NifX family protein
MEEHVRIAVYTLKKGTAQEAADLAQSGMLPIFKSHPGFVRYGIGLLDDGNLVSVSIWETHDEAEAANGAAADFVAKNMADVIALQNSHVGDYFFDEGP